MFLDHFLRLRVSIVNIDHWPIFNIQRATTRVSNHHIEADSTEKYLERILN